VLYGLGAIKNDLLPIFKRIALVAYLSSYRHPGFSPATTPLFFATMFPAALGPLVYLTALWLTGKRRARYSW
jgi:hypothetical protein